MSPDSYFFTIWFNGGVKKLLFYHLYEHEEEKEEDKEEDKEEEEENHYMCCKLLNYILFVKTQI